MKPPGSVLGIIGGGQLGRMISMAASRMGYNSHIYAPDVHSPAGKVSSFFTCADYNDETKLRKFAKSCDVVTYEFENIPSKSAEIVSSVTKLVPGVAPLSISQYRFEEKNFLTNLGIKVANYFLIEDPSQLRESLKKINGEGLLKSRSFGYDGKGQLKLSYKNIDRIWDEFDAGNAVLEEFIDFLCEISIIIVRNREGKIKTYDISENIHKDGILRQSIVPANISGDCINQAKEIGKSIANALELEGVLAVEMFVSKEEELIVNELAPRPHNSGHWTIEACSVSQFEQLVRVAMDLPIGNTSRNYNCNMINLIGNDYNNWKSFLNKPNSHLHIYGKKGIKPNRKMGHVTELTVITKS